MNSLRAFVAAVAAAAAIVGALAASPRARAAGEVQGCFTVPLAHPQLLGNARLGERVAAGGRIIVALAPGEASSAEPQGAVHVWRRSGAGPWVWDARLPIPNAHSNALPASIAVAPLGDRIAIGDPSNSPTGGAPIRGAVLIYFYNGTQWVLEQRIASPEVGANPQNEFGRAVAMTSDRLTVGLIRTDYDSRRATASVVCYQRTGSVWSQTQLIHALPNTTEVGGRGLFMGFGYALAMQPPGDLLIGAPLEGDGPGLQDSRGAAYRYILTDIPGGWVQQARLVASDRHPDDRFGDAVAISSVNSIIGAPGHDEVAMNAGAAYFFAPISGVWTQTAKFLPDPSASGFSHNAFGSSVAASSESTFAVVGALGQFTLFGSGGYGNSGAAYIYNRTSTTAWARQSRRSPLHSFAGILDLDLRSGASVAILNQSTVSASGPTFAPTVVIGSPGALGGLEDSGVLNLVGVEPLLPAVDCNQNGVQDLCERNYIPSSDRNFNGVLDVCEPCIADWDRNTLVNADDVFAYLRAWYAALPGCPPGTAPCPADLDGNRVVNSNDLFLFIDEWFRGCR